MFELIDSLLTWITENVATLLAIFLFTVAAVYFGARIIVVGFARWRTNAFNRFGGSRRFKKPKTWFHLRSLKLHRALGRLLASKDLREFYAHVDDYKVDRDEKRLYLRNAWLSPHKDAAQASVAQNKATIRGKHFEVRKQIRDAEKHVTVRPLPEAYPVAGDREDHLEVVLDLNRKKRTEVQGLLENITSAMEAESTELYEKGRTNSTESFIVHMTKPESILTAKKIGASFFAENPSKEWNALPLAMDEFGQPWSLPTTHSIIFGMTGSGKGSPIQGTIWQVLPYVLRGEAELYGSDLKESELLPYEFSSIFTDLAFNADDSIEIISSLYKELIERNKMKRALMSFEAGNSDLKRRIPATKKTPMKILIIDEFLSLMLELHQMGAQGKAAISTLAKVMALGRSLGFYVLAATQVADKELLGRTRDNFVNAIVLRNQASVHMNELFLGEGCIDRGFDARKIEQSTDKNGYRTSGIGYAMGETGDPVLVRFAYMEDEDISTLVRENPNPKKMALLNSGGLEAAMEKRDDHAMDRLYDEELNDRLEELNSSDREGFMSALSTFKKTQEKADSLGLS